MSAESPEEESDERAESPEEESDEREQSSISNGPICFLAPNHWIHSLRKQVAFENAVVCWSAVVLRFRAEIGFVR